MKKILAISLTISFIGLSAFIPISKNGKKATILSTKFDDEDWTFMEFTSDPPTDQIVSAYDTRTGITEEVLICPSSGVPCNVKVTVNGQTYTIHDQKGRNRGTIEIWN